MKNTDGVIILFIMLFSILFILCIYIYNIYIYITRSTVDTKTYHILHLTYITHTYIKYAHVHSNIYIYTQYIRSMSV